MLGTVERSGRQTCTERGFPVVDDGAGHPLARDGAALAFLLCVGVRSQRPRATSRTRSAAAILRRDLVPAKGEWRTVGESIVDHLRFRHPERRSGEALQRAAEARVPDRDLRLLPLVDPDGVRDVAVARTRCCRAGSTCSAAGRSARTMHFIVAWLLVAFVADARVRGDRQRILEQHAVDDHRPLSGPNRRTTRCHIDRTIPRTAAPSSRSYCGRRRGAGWPAATRLAERVVPESARRRRAAETRRTAAAHLAPLDGAGIHRGRSLAAFRSNGTSKPDKPRVPGARAQRVRRLGARSRRAGRSAGEVHARASCARCRAARRSRVTTASRAGARSENGPACRSSEVLARVQPAAGARLRRVSIAPIRCRAASSTTRASTWTMRTTRRRCSRTR